LNGYKLNFTRDAEKALERIYRADRRLYGRFGAAFEEIQSNPACGKPLQQDLRGLFSYRLGSYRILYETHHHKLLIVIIDLGHRKAIYGGH